MPSITVSSWSLNRLALPISLLSRQPSLPHIWNDNLCQSVHCCRALTRSELIGVFKSVPCQISLQNVRDPCWLRSCSLDMALQSQCACNVLVVGSDLPQYPLQAQVL